MAAKGGFAEVDQLTWETWWPGGEPSKTGGHIGKYTMRRLGARGWVAIEKGVATLTPIGWSHLPDAAKRVDMSFDQLCRSVGLTSEEIAKLVWRLQKGIER